MARAKCGHCNLTIWIRGSWYRPGVPANEQMFMVQKRGAQLTGQLIGHCNKGRDFFLLRSPALKRWGAPRGQG